jgi:outer membrane immunogenic protein
MKRILLASAAFVAAFSLVGGASAADLQRPIMPKAPIAAPLPIYNWTGFYIGINGGGGFGTGGIDTPVGSTSFDTSGGLVGGTLGYNLQTGPWVWGLEGDIDWTNLRGSTGSAVCVGCGISNSWLATVRGRLGYAMNRFMPYITGGLAVGDVKLTVPGFAGTSDTRVGWTIGGGAEFALIGNWTAKAEYLYVDLGSTDCSVGSCGLPGPISGSFHSHIVRAGLNYRF